MAQHGPRERAPTAAGPPAQIDSDEDAGERVRTGRDRRQVAAAAAAAVLAALRVYWEMRTDACMLHGSVYRGTHVSHLACFAAYIMRYCAPRAPAAVKRVNKSSYHSRPAYSHVIQTTMYMYSSV